MRLLISVDYEMAEDLVSVTDYSFTWKSKPEFFNDKEVDAQIQEGIRQYFEPKTVIF